MSQLAPCNEHDTSVDEPASSVLALTGQVTHSPSLLSPIERIPTEILDTIFTFIHKSTKYYSLSVYHSDPCSLSLPLSQVCSRWRRTIRSRPNLWASICIDANCVRGEIRHVVKVHLENAGSHPLRIRLVAHSSQFPPSSTFGNDVLRMIIPELRRCEELVFHGEWDELAQVAPIQRSFTFPHLRSLDSDTCLSALIDGIGLVPPTFLWFSRALKIAPKLATVNIAGIVSLAVLPCHQLTTVCGSELEVAQVARILRSCPDLQNLEVVFLLAGPDPSPNVIVHSSLRELTIHIDADWLVEVIGPLARFSLPGLQTFTLDILPEEQDPVDPTSAVIAIIQCFSASLRKLVLVAGSLNVHRTFFTKILHICPNLHCFAAEVDAIHSKVDNGSECILHLIQSLTITDTSQTLFATELTELNVHEYSTHMTSDYVTAFLDMVESRSTGIRVTRLMDVELKYTRRPFVQPGLDYIDSYIPDSSIAERIKQLSQKEIHCAIGPIRG